MMRVVVWWWCQEVKWSDACLPAGTFPDEQIPVVVCMSNKVSGTNVLIVSGSRGLSDVF
jgi:hypothetical protein